MKNLFFIASFVLAFSNVSAPVEIREFSNGNVRVISAQNERNMFQIERQAGTVSGVRVMTMNNQNEVSILTIQMQLGSESSRNLSGNPAISFNIAFVGEALAEMLNNNVITEVNVADARAALAI